MWSTNHAIRLDHKTMYEQSLMQFLALSDAMDQVNQSAFQLFHYYGNIEMSRALLTFEQIYIPSSTVNKNSVITNR
jgi:dimeric dUTPase (all-alpha-NTP-PPase superfamily)